MKVFDLFSGCGGFTLGFERAGMKTVAFCEIDRDCANILKKHWPKVPLYNDVRKLNAIRFKGTVDVVCGGFPCTDVSISGDKAGIDGPETSLYKHMLRIIGECRPKYAIFENVAGLLTGNRGRWFAKFLYDLAEIGYDAEWNNIEAAYVGAAHLRDRVWIVAYPARQHDSSRNPQSPKRQKSESGESASTIEISSNSGVRECKGVSKISYDIQQQIELIRSDPAKRGRFDLTEPCILRTNDGVSRRLDRRRIKMLGRSIVPNIAEAIGLGIIEYDKSL